jgi:hypothetical protein
MVLIPGIMMVVADGKIEFIQSPKKHVTGSERLPHNGIYRTMPE